MLHVTKVLCLILAAAVIAHGYLNSGNSHSTGPNNLDNLVSSVAVGGALLWAQESYAKAINKAKTSIVSKHESMTQNLESIMERVSSTLRQLQQRDDAYNNTIIESRRRYATWEAVIRGQLFSILNEALDRFDNAMDEVETYVVMYKQNRIPEDEAVIFIEEDKFQLPKIVASTKSKFNAVGAIINRGPA